MKAGPSRLLLVSVIALASLLAACSPGIGASPTLQAIRRVGLMHVGTDHNPPSLATLVAGLGGLGWFDGSASLVMQQLIGDGTMVQGRMKQLQGQYEGPRIDLIWRNLEPGEADDQAATFVAEHVDVIVAFEDKSIAAAQAATAKMEHPIPVVFLHPSDPVRDGLVESLSHPGGNLTGVFGARDPVVRQLELYKEIMPGLRRLLTLVDPDPTDKATPVLLAEAKDAAQRLGLELDIAEASTAADLERAFHSLTPGEVDGAFLLSPSLRLNFSKVTIELATAANLPVQAHRKEWVEQGALFSLGVDVGPVGDAGARFVDSILRGKSPADLPVEEVSKIQFAINLARARELGIVVPENVITRADVVYR
jgi:putative tryptophan/tyrosine transport system substrate-binding protein